jgi:ACT domain-containing protein
MEPAARRYFFARTLARLNMFFSMEVQRMRAVITVIGRDMVGILAKVSATCAEANANVIEVNQSVLQEFFAMVMLVDMEKMNCGLPELQENLKKNAEGMVIHVMHENIFNSMHRI